MRTSGAALLLVALASVASAQPRFVTAEEGAAMHLERFASVTKPRCEAETEKPDEIVVCGRVRPSYRVPSDDQPGARTPGETPSGMAAMNAGGCERLCHQPVKIDIVNTRNGGAVGWVVEQVGRLKDAN